MRPLQNPSRSPWLATGWWLTAALLLARLLPLAVRPGMFFDGEIYATIARNMAVGNGDFWHLHLEPQATVEWFDAPPLAMWLESLLFHAFGDHFWVEKLYSALTAVGTALLLTMIWRMLVGSQSKWRHYAWLPVALWAAVPSWAVMYGSNMLENTLGLFAAASVYCCLRAVTCRRHSLAWTMAAALGLLGATLSKGPFGLFPLVTPVAAGTLLHGRTLWKSLFDSLVLGTIFVLFARLLLLEPEAIRFLSGYLDQQLLASLFGKGGTVTSHMGRLYVISQMVHQLVLPAGLAAATIIWARLRNAPSRDSKSMPNGSTDSSWDASDARLRSAMAFSLFMGASASLPIMLSAKQWGHYPFPSYAYFALGLGVWCAPAVAEIARTLQSLRIATRLWLRPLTCAVVAMLSYVLADRPSRDLDVCRDAQIIERLVPQRSILGIGSELAEDVSLRFNLLRWGNLQLREGATQSPYWLTPNGIAPPPDYLPIAADLHNYRLYQRDDNSAVARRSTDERLLDAERVIRR